MGQPAVDIFQQIIWIVDCSASMAHDGRIQSLNNAIHEAIPHFASAAARIRSPRFRMRAVKFSDQASWHIRWPQPVHAFQWPEVHAQGASAFGAACNFLVEALQPLALSPSARPPVLVLLSDGYPSDDYRPGLERLLDVQFTAASPRFAIAVGEDADESLLEEFIAHPERRPFREDSPVALVRAILASVEIVPDQPPSGQILQELKRTGVMDKAKVSNAKKMNIPDIW